MMAIMTATMTAIATVVDAIVITVTTAAMMTTDHRGATVALTLLVDRWQVLGPVWAQRSWPAATKVTGPIPLTDMTTLDIMVDPVGRLDGTRPTRIPILLKMTSAHTSMSLPLVVNHRRITDLSPWRSKHQVRAGLHARGPVCQRAATPADMSRAAARRTSRSQRSQSHRSKAS